MRLGIAAFVVFMVLLFIWAWVGCVPGESCPQCYDGDPDPWYEC